MDESVFSSAHDFLESLFEGDSSGHDIWHTMRVHDMAVSICREEGGDMDVVRLAALLHDADDRKLFGDNGLPTPVVSWIPRGSRRMCRVV